MLKEAELKLKVGVNQALNVIKFRLKRGLRHVIVEYKKHVAITNNIIQKLRHQFLWSIGTFQY